MFGWLALELTGNHAELLFINPISLQFVQASQDLMLGPTIAFAKLRQSANFLGFLFIPREPE